MASEPFKRGDVWYIRYSLTLPNGGRKQKMVACKGMTKKEAAQKLRQILTQIHRGEYVEPSKITLETYLEQWMQRQQTRLSPTTWYGYQKYIDLHINPELGDIRLDRLTPATIQKLYDKLESKEIGGKGLAPKTIRNIHGILNSALTQAERQEMITRNPAARVDQPRAVRSEARTASEEEITKLLGAIEGTRWYTPVLIVVGTGLRRGEVLALKWEDYDPTQRTLTVRRSIAQVAGKVIAKSPKNGRTRIVKIPAFLAEFLAQLKEDHDAQVRFTPAFHDEGWICCDDTGYLLTPGALGTAFRRIALEAGVQTRLHGLRHAQATLLITGGVAGKIASERLGHSTISITQDIYSHVLPHDQDAAAELIDQKLRKCLPKAPSRN